MGKVGKGWDKFSFQNKRQYLVHQFQMLLFYQKKKHPHQCHPTKKTKWFTSRTSNKKQIEQVHIQNENSAEFEATYKQWMDALDDVCYHDLPPTFYSFCKPIYENGDKIVEMYLHGYEDYEICSSVSCPKNFFEDGKKNKRNQILMLKVINLTNNFLLLIILLV